MGTSSGGVLNWSVPAAMWVGALSAQAHIRGKWNHIAKVSTQLIPSHSTKGSVELLLGPLHVTEMHSNSQTHLAYRAAGKRLGVTGTEAQNWVQKGGSSFWLAKFDV